MRIMIRKCTCKIASTIVMVFPVPGGPNTMYGANPDVQFNMLITARFCSSFFNMLLLMNLKEKL